MKQSIAVVFGLWLVILPFISSLSIGILRYEMVVFPTIVLQLLLLGVVLLVGYKKVVRSEIYISKTDILILIFAIYILARLAINKKYLIDELGVYKWILLLLSYVILRIVEYSILIFKFFVISVLLQAIIVIMQKYNYIESFHNFFDVTGTFGNPGQVAGFLAVGLIVVVAFLSSFLKQFRLAPIYLHGLVLLIIVAALWFADSRASFITVLVGVFCLFYREILMLLKLFYKLIIPILLVVVLIMGFSLFCYRPASVNARLLVWRVSLDMIMDKPLWGYGIGGFSREYMLYQAKYFNENPNSKFLMVADNVGHPYNELLRIVIEHGIVGGVLIAILFFSVFTFRAKGKKDVAIKAILGGLVTFSMFSYPCYVLPLLILFPIIIGAAESKQCFSFCIRKLTVISLQIICVILVIVTFKAALFYYHMSLKTKKLFEENVQIFSKDEIVRLIPNISFANFYAVYISINNDAFSDILVHYLPPSCETYCTYGDVCKLRGNIDQAEEFYKKASFMIPTRLVPNYELWQLYKSKRDTVQAIEKAKAILKQPLKVENTFTIRIKNEVRHFLQKSL